ncbi:MAG: hypothetical protein V4629_05230 [Pseudomonadota bacterium]
MNKFYDPDQCTWSFHAGQLFAELYDIGMRYEGFTICPWSIHENSGKRSGTDLGFFDNDLSPRPSYYHTLLLGQNMKSKNIKNTDNQSNVKVLSMGDSSGISVMILNKDKNVSYPYAVKLDLNVISNQALKIQIDAGLNKEIQGQINAKSTHMLVFCPNGKLSKKFTYTSVNAEYKQAPIKTDYISCLFQ